jgi:3-phenylpropionate/cinnamic acid dioxygenase small subunit
VVVVAEGSAPEGRVVNDLQQIERVLYDYAWACDEGDWAALPGVFTPDAELDYSTTGGPAAGRDEVVSWLEESLSQVEMIQHVVSNVRIDVDGDTAAGRAMFFTSVRLPGLDGVLLTGGYYDLRLTRTDEGWRIRRLVEDNRWMQQLAPPA